MAKTYTQTPNSYTDHSTFGGLIYPSDFETDYRGKDNTKGSPIAQRIASDQRFDNSCRVNREKQGK